MLSRNQFKASEHLTAICGFHCGNDSIHVGVTYNDEGDERVIHFQSGQHIPLDNLDDPRFEHYMFNPIDLNPSLIPSLAALAELVSQNILEPFTFNRGNVVYEGGKFEQVTGGYVYNHTAERIVNCGVFTVGLLKTYDYDLIDWDTWPAAPPANLDPYLNDWFQANAVPNQEREYYYRSAKAIRGKHIIVSPSTPTKPSPYPETVALSDRLIAELTTL